MQNKTAFVLDIPADGDGNSVHNKILLSLSKEDLGRVLPRLELSTSSCTRCYTKPARRLNPGTS